MYFPLRKYMTELEGVKPCPARGRGSRGLRVLDARERSVHVEQFLLQRLVQPFDLPGGRDRGLVSRWVMPFARQIRSNSTSAGRGPPNRPVNQSPRQSGGPERG